MWFADLRVSAAFAARAYLAGLGVRLGRLVVLHFDDRPPVWWRGSRRQWGEYERLAPKERAGYLEQHGLAG
jgi:hypothetical protein